MKRGTTIRWSEEIKPGLFWCLTNGGCYQSMNLAGPYIFKADSDEAAIEIERKALQHELDNWELKPC